MEEIDLKELLQMFWEKKVKILLIVEVFVILGVIYTLCFVTPKYEAKTTLLLATNSSSTSSLEPGKETTITTTDVTINSKLVSTYRELVRSTKVIRKVISNLGINVSEASIKKNVSVTAVGDTEVIEIAVKNEDSALATSVANEIAKVFMENIQEYYGIDNVHVVDRAEENKEPVNVNHIKDVVIFAFVGFAIGCAYILLANMLDTKIKSPDDIERVTGFTVLATFPVYNTDEKAKKGGKREWEKN